MFMFPRISMQLFRIPKGKKLKLGVLLVLSNYYAILWNFKVKKLNLQLF